MRNAKTEVVPSASRMMGSLRDIGYDLGSAVADIVDNSVDAGAELVRIDLVHEGKGSWIRISDDGVGMTERALDEAMRYGSRRKYEADDLGRFGLGLKTASLSQCRSLTVASRTTALGRTAIRRWDLDEVELTDRWLLERLTRRSAPAAAVDPLKGDCGTVVLWEKLDRVEGFSSPSSAWARDALQRDSEMLKKHLGMVFHRFMDGTAAGPRLQIAVNDVLVSPWDPFSTDESETSCLKPQDLSYEGSDGRAVNVRVTPYVLPNRLQYSSANAHEQASGAKRWNRQQGFYIYRNDRLIQSGGWNRLRTMDEHSKLARIAIDIPEDGESDWRLNVSKMSVAVPSKLRGQLRTLAGSVAAVAQERYRASSDGSMELGSADQSTSGNTDAFRLADHWTPIAAVLEDELGTDPSRLDRILEKLINSSEVRNGVPSGHRETQMQG